MIAGIHLTRCRVCRIPVRCGLFFIVAFVAGCSDSASSYKPLAKIVSEADRVVLYEGLPHQTAEKDLLAKELAEKNTLAIGGFSFYAEPMSLSKTEAFALTELFDDVDAFSRDTPGSWGTKCGPYHPDFAIEWTERDNVVRILICFGCGEGKVFGGPSELYLSLAAGAEDKLKAILKDRWQNRPKTDWAKQSRL